VLGDDVQIVGNLIDAEVPKNQLAAEQKNTDADTGGDD
jgi:hypothetical protein